MNLIKIENFIKSVGFFTFVTLLTSMSAIGSEIKKTGVKVKPSIQWHQNPEGTVELTILKALPHESILSFQNGSLTTDIKYFSAPRCYLKLKDQFKGESIESSSSPHTIKEALHLYQQGTSTVTFTFESQSPLQELTCISNHSKSMNLNQIAQTLGSGFEIKLTHDLDKILFQDLTPKIVDKEKLKNEDTFAALSIQGTKMTWGR